MLSSMPLAFNLFAPLRFNLPLAAKVIRSLVPDIDLASALHVGFEHSPGRLSLELTGDRSAFDVAISYERTDGERGFIGFEIKYSESGSESVHKLDPRHEQLARSSELYKNPSSAVLRTGACHQLLREHLLAHAACIRGDYAEARFVFIAPRHNHILQQGARLYASHLTELGPDTVPFLNLELEQVIEAIARAGEMHYAFALHDRYTAWSKIDAVIEEALSAQQRDWQIVAPPLPTLSLVTQAA
jgi:hypothetical protein